MGSTMEARRAGIPAARMLAASKRSVPPMNATGSYGFGSSPVYEPKFATHILCHGTRYRAIRGYPYRASFPSQGSGCRSGEAPHGERHGGSFRNPCIPQCDFAGGIAAHRRGHAPAGACDRIAEAAEQGHRNSSGIMQTGERGPRHPSAWHKGEGVPRSRLLRRGPGV